MKIINKWISKWKEFQSKREIAYFGTSLYDELKVNPLPSLLLILFSVLFFTFSLPYIYYLGKFFYWFVGVLEITKVLKIPFLDELRYYHYLSAFVYFYIVTSLLIDISRLLNKWNIRTVFVKNEIWQIQRFGFGKKLIKFNLETDGLELGYEHGGFSDYLGCNRLIWEKNGKTLFVTPYFFPYKKNKTLVNRILKR
ncbi:hypothetical protein ND861_08910 [Leptospira sp. 2 VSF19]|uniref:DUF304 domain-containing protein n=1 Tax=Leptospira soteropolitanensis TaxID=2950025 RepID=A0AAW5VFG1_9LEPT|nr:hypothetical protein [Leptospira soteropolitanensis]MCW7492678.1 hypothetical protein [Leptospira soteropolitanensis]MCW7500361.1 hypothetical protein [Leptospira soteropolitanensis]MCW7522604.1 hypothetical protein [Leptospira soteropolitanensis]MCW7526460.1 hypothetical protein [Leptospira soteropolitanensis]MCW7530331.1 hypothetical protein [Leptospira soteropolitanensis]